jgi:hypothetical protein
VEEENVRASEVKKAYEIGVIFTAIDVAQNIK